MSAPISRRLQQLAELLDVHDQHCRTLDGRLISIAGPLGTIKPYRGQLLVSIQQRTSAAILRRLLGLGVLDVEGDGNLKVVRTPRADEAIALRDLIGASRRRT